MSCNAISTSVLQRLCAVTPSTALRMLTWTPECVSQVKVEVIWKKALRRGTFRRPWSYA